MAGMTDKETKPLYDAAHGGEALPADILAVRGRGVLSRIVLAAQGAGYDTASHVALVIGANPALIIEAVHPRVRVRPLEEAIAEADKAWILHNLTLSDEERATIVRAACRFSSLSYGYPMLILHAFNAAFATNRFTNLLRGRNIDPVAASGASNGATPKNKAEWWIRVAILLLSPLLASLFVAGVIRQVLGRLLGSSLFALLEGLALFLLGITFVRSHPYFSWKWPAVALSYSWAIWIVFLELSAMEP